MTNELDRQIQLALDEIGEIQPWQDEDTGAWVFSSPLYDLEGHAETPEKAIVTYRAWLSEFIEERLKDNLAPNVEARSPGRGGRREGAGRPKADIETRPVRLIEPLALQLKGNPALQVKILDWLESQKAV